MNIAYIPYHSFGAFLVRYPRVAGLVGLVVACMFAVLGVLSWLSLQAFGDQPTPISLAVSGGMISEERQWVVVEDAHWDCSSMAPFGFGSDSRVEAMFTDEAGTVVVVAVLSPEVPCAELTASPPTGEIYRMSEHRYARLKDKGRLDNYSNATTYLEMCAYCGPGNSRIGVALGLIFVPLGLAMYPLALFSKRRTLQHKSTS